MNIITMIGDGKFIIFNCIDQFLNVIIGIQLKISTESFSNGLEEKKDRKKFEKMIDYSMFTMIGR